MKLTKQTARILSLMFLGNLLLQSQAVPGGSNLVFYGIAALALIIFFFIVVSVADNFMVIESKQVGIHENMGLFPRINEIFSGGKPDYLEGKHLIQVKSGYDIPIEGEPVPEIDPGLKATRFAISPPDFIGLMPIPKVTVEEGDEVKAGDTVFYDKKLERIKFAAPVSGQVIEVKRGLKRSIVGIVILADKEQQSRRYDIPAQTATREELVEFLLESGAWPGIRQRPYNVVADPDIVPRDIFVTTFDTAPLAPDMALALRGREGEFQAGVDVLNRLTDGLVYLGLDGNGDAASPYEAITGAQKRYFRGPHPAGNVGTQIHLTHPCGPGPETVWTLDVNAVLLIGGLFANGKYDTKRLVTLGGYPFTAPRYAETYAGANIKELTDGELAEPNVRVISGDVLTGIQAGDESYLGFFHNQISAIREGNEAEIFGWLLPIKDRASISPTIPTLTNNLEVTTNSHGEERAFVVNLDYEQVMPMDIYTQQLMKAIMVNDFENMEGLGIYELVEEDVALPEFSCVSKQPLQQILRRGLDTMREQG